MASSGGVVIEPLPMNDDEQAIRETLQADDVPEAVVAGCVAVWRRARTRLPELTVDPIEVASLALARVAHDPARFETLATLDWYELLLAASCRRGDAKALRRLDEEYMARSRPALRDLGLDVATIEGVLQDVRTLLVAPRQEAPPRICGYAGQGGLRKLVRVIAVREGLARLRKQQRECPSDEDRLFERHGASLDPELAGIERQHRVALKAAFEAAVSELTSRQRNLLRLQTLDGLPVEQIAKLYQVHRVTASRWLGDARAAVAKGTRRHLRQALQLDTRGMASLIRVVQSQIDMSLERILATRGPVLEDEPPETSNDA